MRIKTLFGFSTLSVFTLSLISCSNHLTFEELTITKKEYSEINTKSYTSPKLKYSILLPESFELTRQICSDTSCYELLLDTLTEFEKGPDMISIYKFTSNEIELENVWHDLSINTLSLEDFRLHSKGVTRYLSMPSYYEYFDYTIGGDKTASISFLFHGNDLTFYLLVLQVNTTVSEYPNNLKKLLYSAKSVSLLH